MKKLFTLMLMLFACIGIKAAAPNNLYLFGNAPFGDWAYNPIASGKATQMTKSGSTFTWSGTISSTCYFAFCTQDGSDWNTFNNTYRYTSTTQAVSLNTSYDLSTGDRSMKLNAGDYTITVDWSGSTPKMTVTGYTPPVVITSYSVIGAQELFGGSGWDTDVDLTETSTGVYSTTLSNVVLAAGNYEYKARANHQWGIAEYPDAGNNTLTIPASGTYNIVFTLTLSSSTLTADATLVSGGETEVYLRGEFDWATGDKMTKEATGNVYTLTKTFTDATEFKFVSGSTWYGSAESAVQAITEATKDNIATSTDGGAPNFSLPAGEWTFTFNLDNATFSVAGTWPVVPVQNDVYILGNGGWDASVGVQMETTDDVNYSKTITTADSGDGYAYIGFSTKLGSSSTDWDGIAAYRFGPEADGENYWITETTINTDIAYVTSNYKSIRIPAGMEVTVSVNKTAQTFRVAGTWPAPADPEVYLFGSFDSWATGLQMTKEATGNVYTLTTTFVAESEFKFLEGSTWYGTTESAVQAITEATKDNIATSTDGGAQNFSLPAGEWTFTFNLDNATFSVAGTWPAPVVNNKVYIIGNGVAGAWDPSDGLEMTTTDDVNYTAELTAVDSGDGAAYFGFTTKLGESSTDWDGIAAYRFGPQADGDNYWITSENINTDIAYVTSGYKSIRVPAGVTYTITVNKTNQTFRVEGTLPEPLKVYILGNNTSQAWGYSTGVEMSTEDHVNFTANITINNYGTGYNTIGFTTKLASTWDGSSEISAYRFGPAATTTIDETNVNTDIPYVTSGYQSVRLVAGLTYIVTVNTANQTFKIATDPSADADAYLVGTSSGWVNNNTYKFTKGTDNLYHLDNVSLSNGEEFKVVVQDGLLKTNYVAAENLWTNRRISEANHVNVPMGNTGSYNFYLRSAGTYSITFDAEGKQLTVEKSGAWTAETTNNLYILGNAANWDPTAGVAMTTTDNINFTAELTAADSGDGAAYISFTTMLASSNDETGWNSIAPYRLGPAADGENYWITSETINTDIPFAVINYKGVRIPAGATYTITVNYNAKTFKVAGTIPTPSNTPDHLYFMGDQFGDWAYDAIAQGKVVELDKNGDVFTYTGHVDAGYFCLITQDAADWGDLDNYRYGKDNNDPEIAMDTQYTLTKGTDFHLTLAGTYTFTVDFSGTDPVFSFTGTPDPVSNAPEHLYFMGDNFGNWDAQAIANGTAVELTKNGDVFTYTGHVDAGWFCLITADGEGADADAQWADLNSNYRYGSNSDGNEEDVVADTQYTMAKGARTYHLTASGTYTFTVDFSGTDPVFSFTGTPDPVSNAPEHLYFIGNEFGGWDNAAIANGTAVELTKNGDIFTYTGHVGADGYFCFITQDGADWDDLDNYRYGSNDESTQEDVVMDTQYTMAKGKRSYHLAAAGTYTFTVDFSGANPVFSFTGTPDPVAAADLYLKGSFDTWGTGVQFTDNGDGTYTLADYVLADDTEFQVYDATSDTWYGHNGTAQIDGANHTDVALATGYANNFTIAAGTYTFVVDFDAKTMTVTGTWSTDLYLKGSFDTWGAGAQFTDNGDGTYTLADYVLADDTEFKVYDVGTDTWYGHNGTALINYANHENVTIAEGNDNNFSIAAGTYTFVVDFDAKTMTVSGNFVNPNAGKTLQLRGSFNTWGDTDVFTDNNDGTYTITLQMNKEDEFKIVEVVDPSDSNQDVWYGYNTGSADLFWLNGQARTNVAMEDGNNYYVAVSGEWTITVDYAAKTFNADRVIEKYGVLGDAAIFGTAWDNDVELEAMPIPGDYTVTLSNVDIAAGDYEYKARADKDWGWYDLPAAGNNTLNVPESGLYDITFTMSTLNHDIVAYLTPVTSIALTISDAEYATIYYENVAFEIPEGVTASTYKVQEGHMVASKNVTKNPAGQALVLYKAGGGDITLNIINTGMEAADNENLLVGSVFNEEGISEAGYTYFYLCRKDGTGKVGFYYFTADGSSVNNNAHKAYMRVPNDQVPAGVMGFAFDDALTGITGINAEEILSDGPVYTLSGVRVQNAANLQKGIYVKNGRKFIVK